MGLKRELFHDTTLQPNNKYVYINNIQSLSMFRNCLKTHYEKLETNRPKEYTTEVESALFVQPSDKTSYKYTYHKLVKQKRWLNV